MMLVCSLNMHASPTSRSIMPFLSAVSFVVRLGNTAIHSSKVYDMKRGESSGQVWLDHEIPLCGDVKLEVYHHPRFGTKVCKLELPCSRSQKQLAVTAKTVLVNEAN